MDNTTTKKKTKIHPQVKANFLSNLFFCWTLPLFRLGLKKELTEKDVYPTLETHDANKLVNKIEKAWVRQKELNSRPSLWKAIWQVFKLDILKSMAFYLIVNFAIRIIKPLALGKLMGHYSFGETESSNNNIIYASVIIMATFLEVIIFNLYTMQYIQIAVRVRVACSGLIYRKTLRLGKGELSEISVGHIVNLLSNDMKQLVNFWRSYNYLWAAPIQTVLVLYLIYIISGPTALVGVGFLILLIPTQLFMSKKAANYRFKTAKTTDERIRHMDEIITGIQVIKVYTWEKPFIKLIELIRKKEVKLIKVLNYLEAVLSSFSYFVNRTAVFLCILAYVLIGSSPNAQYVYVVFSFYSILMSTISMKLPLAVSDTLKTNVSISRMENFLSLKEIANTITVRKEIGIRIQNASARWSKDPNHSAILHRINFNVLPRQTVAVVGAVGSGKSSLLQLCLGEIPLVNGLVEIGGKISYASQEAWLFASTVKQNILLGLPMQRDKYEEVIKVCALEEDINQFPYGDNSIVGERGILLSGGQKARINLARALYRDADIYLLDDPLAAVDTKVGKQIFSKCINGYLRDKCTVLVTHQIQYLTLVDKIYLLTDRQIIASGNYHDIQESAADFGKLLKNNETDDETGEQNSDQKVLNRNHKKQNEVKESKASGNVTRQVYTTYVHAFGSYMTVIVLSFLFILTESCATGADYFITFWVNLEQKQIMSNTTLNAFEVLFLNKEICVYFYSTLISLLVTLTVVRSMSFVKCCMCASIRLHNNMFSSIILATMSFFYINSSGRILNRFSRDISSLDLTFPGLLLEAIQITLEIVGSILAISLVNPLTLVPTLVIFVIMFLIRKVYLASSLNLKRMESTSRSPKFTHLVESTKGLTTIRASEACQILEKQFNSLQNVHTAIHYTSISANRTFSVWLDSICVAYLLIVTVFAISEESYGGNIGFVMTRAMSLTGLCQWAVKRWSNLETEMTSVERVVEYSQLEQEDNSKTKTLSNLWPDSGKIEFNSVFLKYTKTNPYVLKNLNFVIKPKEKIGIVGRTGAGKSSLIPVLFRLVEFDGNVFIDDVDTKEISLSLLRSKIAIIPQDPVLFAGTVRKNLDPFDHYKDSEIWNVLEEVQLKDFISNLPSGLFSKLSEGGSNFSVGQKQLICLARALLRKNKILVLDEATANVDPQTDELLQQTIRINFEYCTVLTIAHRLDTVMDADKILVIDDGVIVEFDHPSILLGNRSVFYNLVVESGKTIGNVLSKVAHEVC